MITSTGSSFIFAEKWMRRFYFENLPGLPFKQFGYGSFRVN